jgi:hypothetical protein
MRLRLQKGIALGAVGESAVWDVVTVEDDNPRSEDASIGSLHRDHRGWFFTGPAGALREAASSPLPSAALRFRTRHEALAAVCAAIGAQPQRRRC